MRRGVTSHLDGGDAHLVTRLYPGLRAFASVVAPAEEDPNDLVQEAFVRTLRGGSLSRLEYPKAYLRSAIYHLAVSARRRRAAERRTLVRVGVENPPPEYSWQLDELLRLSPKERAVLYLRVIEDMPYIEIADLLECPPASVRQTASRAKRRLRRLLAEEVHDATA